MIDKPNKNNEKTNNEKASSSSIESEISSHSKPELVSGPISLLLQSEGFKNICLGPDHLGIETIQVEKDSLYEIASFLKVNGFDYLQCQGGYDEGPGRKIVSFYNLIAMQEKLENTSKSFKTREVRLKVFLSRNESINVPSLYSLFKGSDWQERETYDMFGINFEGHPHPKRLLMPEDWKGWPLRKDYVQPDFYEMQDAY